MKRKQLVAALVVTHGRLGHELLTAAEMIVGEIPHMQAVSIGWHDEVESSRREIEEAVRTIDQGSGVIILTDMFGGTPTNLSLSLTAMNQVEVVTGVNLPMIIKLANQSGQEDLSSLARRVEEQGRRQISMASRLLA